MGNAIKLTVDKKLEFFDYILAIRSMADGYFNATNGSYEPYFGELNVIRMFYNLCVKKSKYNKKYPNGINDYKNVTVLVKDKEFMNAYKEALNTDTDDDYFSFSKAYHMAMDMVETKKTSFGQAASTMSDMVQIIIDKLGNLLSDENMEYIKNISAEIAKGSFNPDDIVNAYVKTKRFEDVANNEKVDE